MVRDDFQDAALLLIGHGSTRNTKSTGPVYQHAQELRRRGIFGQVRECFWKVEPRIKGVWESLVAPRIFAVPLFISEGYFTKQAIPAELGLKDDASRCQQQNGQAIHYCAPVGTHPAMTEVILARAAEVVEKHPFPRPLKPSQLALFIAGHGTGRNGNSRQSIERQVELIRGRSLYAEVHPLFIEEAPFIGECYGLTNLKHIVIVPFFISDGLHVEEDIPVLLGEPERVVQARLHSGQPTWRNPSEKKGKLVWYSPSVGTEPHLAEVILERVREAARPKLSPESFGATAHPVSVPS